MRTPAIFRLLVAPIIVVWPNDDSIDCTSVVITLPSDHRRSAQLSSGLHALWDSLVPAPKKNLLLRPQDRARPRLHPLPRQPPVQANPLAARAARKQRDAQSRESSSCRAARPTPAIQFLGRQ